MVVLLKIALRIGGKNMDMTSRMSAREMIEQLVDSNSFVEVGALMTKRSTDFNLQEKEVPADGVITGYGVIHGNPVYVYCQDEAALKGTIGEIHANKIANMYDLAIKVGVPVIGILNSGGMRLQEGTDGLEGLGKIYQKKAFASGVIPQITAVVGNCGGGTAILSSLSDFSFFAKETGSLYINSPNALKGNQKETLNTSDAEFQAQNGNISFVYDNIPEVLTHIRELISILPSSNDDTSSFAGTSDNLNRLIPNFNETIEDIAIAFHSLSDSHFFLEVKKEYAKEMVTGFIKLNGITVGGIGNRLGLTLEDGSKKEFEDVLTTNGCLKATEFVNFCNAFNIPLLTLTNVSGFKSTIEEEKTIGLASAKLNFAFSNANVPKINVIVGKALGSAYITMNSKHIGADMVFALEDTQIGTMDPVLAAKIMYADKPELIEEKAKEYATLQSSEQSAARRGYVDSLIDSSSLRKHLIYGFEMLHTKRERRPSKKHGTV